MKLTLTPAELIDQLRAWFFPKDRSIYLANGCSLYLPGSYQVGLARIAEITLSASAASVTFSAIPQNFRSLLLISQTRTNRAAEADAIYWQANSDGGANYDHNVANLVGNNTSSITGTIAGTYGQLARVPAATARASNFSPALTLFSGYALTTNEKWSMCLCAEFGNVSATSDMVIQITSARWRNTAAITNLTIAPITGPNFVANSVFTLYGML